MCIRDRLKGVYRLTMSNVPRFGMKMQIMLFGKYFLLQLTSNLNRQTFETANLKTLITKYNSRCLISHANRTTYVSRSSVRLNYTSQTT